MKDRGVVSCFFCQAEDGIRDLVRSRGLGDVYKRQLVPYHEVYQTYLDAAQQAMEFGTVPPGLQELVRAVSYTHLTLPTIYSV